MNVHLLYRRLPTGSAPADGLWIVIQENEAYVVVEAGRARLPTTRDLGPFVACDPIHQIAVVEEGAPSAASPPGHPVLISAVNAAPPGRDGLTLERIGYRGLYGIIDDQLLALVGRATQITDGDLRSRYCGRCGSPTQTSETESVRTCPACGDTHYPRLTPAMIVGVVRDGRLLLASSAPRFRGAFYSVLAGFVEPGETLEECVHREVWEEVNIRVKNLRYFGNQPWPFPHSLMVGFTAEYESGEIVVDERELLDAGWFGPHEMPPVPSEISISGRIIRWFQETYGTGHVDEGHGRRAVSLDQVITPLRTA